MRQLNFIEAVAERDIDLLLLEELNVSAAFQQEFVQQVFGPDTTVSRFEGAWHSVSHPVFHESDLVVIFRSGAGTRLAILVENKIDALAQPDQAVRYSRRGDAGIADGFWDGYQTCLVAPEAYLRSATDAEIYQTHISYENIRDWFLDLGDERSNYRARIMIEAIDQNRRGYQPVPHEHVTGFWQNYWAMVTHEFPQLSLKRRSKVPRDADWPEFRPSELGKGRRILHKWARGAVDLQIDGAVDEVAVIAEVNRAVFNSEGLEVVETGKSASIRLIVPAVDRLREFGAQEEVVRVGLQAAVRLLKISSRVGWPIQEV